MSRENEVTEAIIGAAIEVHRTELAPIHEAQLITYLKLTGCKLGLLLNFNVQLMKHGIKRIALNL